ncbi:MAG: hypothetical protein ACK58J_27170, partial [Planctomyces sp.]
YGLTGREGRLRLPLYEVHGNHDSPRGDGYAVQQIRRRNRERVGLTAVSENGLHYSWDWGPVHFVNLGIVVGEVSEPARRRRYAPLGSLQFLQDDLQKHVGSSGRPIVVTHHIDVLRYAQPLPVETVKAEGMEWDPADVHAYYEALRVSRVAGILVFSSFSFLVSPFCGRRAWHPSPLAGALVSTHHPNSREGRSSAICFSFDNGICSRVANVDNKMCTPASSAGAV